MNFTQRTLGDKIRVNENINFIFWKKLTKIFEEMHKNDYFSKCYPLTYPDYNDMYAGCVYDCDSKELSLDIAFYTDGALSWPLVTSKKSISNVTENWMPTEYQVFDLIEFLYKVTKSVKVQYYTTYSGHGEEIDIKTLSFPEDDKSANKKFADKVNVLLRDARMIYEFDPQTGQIKKILNEGTKYLIENALNFSEFTFDSEYQNFLKGACEDIASSRLEHNYQALKKLWYAYERLKCYFGAVNQKMKIKSINKIKDLFSCDTTFSDMVNLEMEFLTDYGNENLIRHSEPYQKSLKNRRQINYIFNRCLSFIILIQDEIVAYEKMYVDN
ncbi:hypothetical protein FPL18_17125 [Acinetobacter gyllenbergii]|nr:hypothetical protein FPL18_17125 [Acinetobacter gyllenbergii]